MQNENIEAVSGVEDRASVYSVKTPKDQLDD